MEWINENMALLIALFGSISVLIPLLKNAYKENKDVYEKGKFIIERYNAMMLDGNLTNKELKELAAEIGKLAIEIKEAYEINKGLWNKIKAIFNGNKKKKA